MRGFRFFCLAGAVVISAVPLLAQVTQQPPPASTSSRAPQGPAKRAHHDGVLDAGSVSNGVYRNPALAVSCRIPDGWVLRTEEMNREDQLTEAPRADRHEEPAARTATEDKSRDPKAGRVLLAAFSRPPEARGEEINASILIVAEGAAAYPGLNEAVQYVAPVTEIAKARGFSAVEEPYEFPVGTKGLVRADFRKDVGTRVMRQSTLIMLLHGYAVSFTFIAGTETDIDDLIAGLSFTPGGKPAK